MEVLIFHGGDEPSLRPISCWFQTTQNSSFIEAEGAPYSEVVPGVERK